MTQHVYDPEFWEILPVNLGSEPARMMAFLASSCFFRGFKNNHNCVSGKVKAYSTKWEIPSNAVFSTTIVFKIYYAIFSKDFTAGSLDGG